MRPTRTALLLGLSLAGLAAVAGTLAVRIATAPPAEVELAGYVSPLANRTSNQRHNARLAARALDGWVIGPHGLFSFNRAVGSWSFDRGYRKAPVSYDGELVPSFGGGVCQASSTLYNAALLAGMEVVERHRHSVAPGYVPPGRDAAVAQVDVDLRFRNPYPWPVRIHTSCQGDQLVVRMTGAQRPAERVALTSRILAVRRPQRLTRDMPTGSSRSYLRSPGAPGYRVVVYRVASRDGSEVSRERISEDTYRAMDRIVALGR